MPADVPVLGVASVAVIVTVSATLSLTLMVNVPAASVAVLSPKMPSPLLSNCALPVLLVMVTTVESSVVTVLFPLSLAVTVTLKVTPNCCGVAAVTT